MGKGMQGEQPYEKIELEPEDPSGDVVLGSLKKGTVEWYRKAFEIMQFDPGQEGAISRQVDKVVAGKARYETVAKATRVPWWIIGAIHSMEAGCSFAGVLHNGEKIIGTGKKTTLVPKGRGPFSTWEAAAIDALAYDGINKVSDWEIGNALKMLEAYNGLGYLRYHQEENSPYLWAKSSLNDGKGKYTADGKFDPNAFSEAQVGAACIIKELMNRTLI